MIILAGSKQSSPRPARDFQAVRNLLRIFAALSPALVAATAAHGQTSVPTAVVAARPDSGFSRWIEFVQVTSDSIDRARYNELGSGAGIPLLLRSASTLTAAPATVANTWNARFLTPQFRVVTNSALPFSQNNGSLWAGKGFSTKAAFGISLSRPGFRILLAPEIVSSSNSDWMRDTSFYAPAVPSDRNEFTFPFYVGRFTIDQPLRMGSRPFTRLDAGQSGVFARARTFEFGLTNENEWWGPGLRNALILSNNAPGFPHLVLRTVRPVQSRLGEIEARWLAGGLTESKYFDFDSTNNLRSIAAFAATLRTRWDPNLTVGIARSVYATSTGWTQVPLRWLDVLANTGHPNDPPSKDSLRSAGGRDQLLSLFGRWVFPASGVEAYAELGRTELPKSLRDLLVAPNHSQGYTIGAQWRSMGTGPNAFRLQAEITQLEQSATFRDRPVGSWYTSPRVIQGYTNRGEILGASIGPGASSQWLALDYLAPTWRIGGFAGRIRWNEDVHTNYGFPAYMAYCSHDISIYPGLRGSKSGSFGSLTADLSLQNRLNVFYLNGGGCPNNGRRLDIRNKTLSITYSPFKDR